jgi:hypothetical protein
VLGAGRRLTGKPRKRTALTGRRFTVRRLASSDFVFYSTAQSTPTMRSMPSDSQTPLGPTRRRTGVEHSRLLKNGGAHGRAPRLTPAISSVRCRRGMRRISNRLPRERRPRRQARDGSAGADLDGAVRKRNRSTRASSHRLAASAISCDLRLKQRSAPERASTAGLPTPAAKGGPQIDKQARIQTRNARPFA